MKNLAVNTFVTFIFFYFYSYKGAAQNIYTFAGNGGAGYSGDGGGATLAQISYPSEVAIDISGNLYIADWLNKRIRKVNASGTITTIAGTGTAGFSGDGGPANLAQITSVNGIDVDSFGNIYFSDSQNNRIRKINTSGIISTIAGTSVSGYSGDGGLATSAQISSPAGITVDAIGNIYFSDLNNYCIRKINTSGTITTIAGTGMAGFSGDGGSAILAKINQVYGISIDASGNLYIADAANYRIRQINNSGIISTIAGTGVQGQSGDGGLASIAELNSPYGVELDASGNIYISDKGNHRIRKVNSSGIINTVAGNGIFGFSGDGATASAARLNQPNCVALDASGNIYISDSFNNRIRVVCNTNCLAGISEAEIGNPGINVYPNPVSNSLYIETNKNEFENSEIEITNLLGQMILKLPHSNTIDVSSLIQGIYYVKIKNSTEQRVFKIIKE